MYYAKARMYDSESRRFVATDPIKGSVADPQSMVQYTYCLDNPLKYVDPTGLAAAIAWDEKNLSSTEKEKIAQCQKDYNAAKAAGNKDAMDAAHDAAEKIRQPNRSGTETGTADGNTVGVPAPKNTKPDISPEAKDLINKVTDRINNMTDKEIIELAKLSGMPAPSIDSLNASQIAELANKMRQELISDAVKIIENMNSASANGAPRVGTMSTSIFVMTPADIDKKIQESMAQLYSAQIDLYTMIRLEKDLLDLSERGHSEEVTNIAKILKLLPPTSYSPTDSWSAEDILDFIAFETGKSRMWEVSPELLSAKGKLEAELAARGWSITYTSAYRPLIYQAHFYDVTYGDASKTSEGKAEAKKHGLTDKNGNPTLVAKPNPADGHIAGSAFDAYVRNEKGVALNDKSWIDNELQKLATASGLNVGFSNREGAKKDYIHFYIKK